MLVGITAANLPARLEPEGCCVSSSDTALAVLVGVMAVEAADFVSHLLATLCTLTCTDYCALRRVRKVPFISGGL